jgi:HEAT repeat protein
MVDQAEIHRNAVSCEVEERKEAADQLRDNFTDLPDKEEAWKDLHRLTEDEDGDVRWGATFALGSAFQHVPDKKQACEDLHRLTQDKVSDMRSAAAESLGVAFLHIPDKEQAWKDLIRLTQDEDSVVRLVTTSESLGVAFQHVPDKKQAWEDLHRLTQDEVSDMRSAAAESLGVAFPHIPDKEQAWEDLHRLTQDEDKDEDDFVRMSAACALGAAFQHIPDKERAWDDLRRLTQDKISDVGLCAADSIGAAFPHISDKEQAWKYLHRLTRDEDVYVRWGTASSLGVAFPHIPDKEQAWQDLRRLTQDEDRVVRHSAASSLGVAFPHIPDKEQAWQDLRRLTQDDNDDVRASANHSLGRAHIFKATEAENEENFRKELEKALKFFEKSSKEAAYFNPSSFCLPFYRSFYTITFKKAGAEGEVRKYFDEAKRASEGSTNKETLLEAVENLANALSEAQKVTDFGAMKSDLNTYRRYCDRAVDLIGDAAEGAPGAARVLQRGGLIIGDRIKRLLEEVKKTSEDVCKTASLPESELGCRTEQHAEIALSTDNPIIIDREINHILNDFERWSHSISDENEKEYVQGMISDAGEDDTRGKISIVRSLLSRALTFSKDGGGEVEPTTDKTRSDGHTPQKTDRSTTVFAESGSNVTVTQTETESGDVTVTHDATVTKEPQPEEHRTDHRKKTAIEIIAAFAVSVLVVILSPRYLENLTPIAATFLAFSILIILLLIILTRNRDKSS